MKAEELFEKLKYKKQTGFESICYVYENEDTADFEIIFDLKNKTIHTHGACSDKSISMDELEAIKKQCEELEWVCNKSQKETNFEHYFEKIKELVSLYYCNPQTIANGLMAVADEDILGTGLITDAILDWCKKTYKSRDYCLSEFEYELLESYLNSDEKVASLCIKDVKVLQNMQKKGHFQNVDWYTPIRDILDCSEIKKDVEKGEK